MTELIILGGYKCDLNVTLRANADSDKIHFQPVTLECMLNHL